MTKNSSLFSRRIPRHLTMFLVLVACLTFLSRIALSQEKPNSRRKSSSAPLQLANSVVTSQIQKLPNADDLLQQLSGTDGLIVWPKSMWIDSTYDRYSYESVESEAVKYLVLHLALGNRSTEEITVSREEILLEMQGAELQVNQLPKQAQISLRSDGAEQDKAQFRLPPILKIPPGRSLWFWCAFAPLPELPAIPEMTLKVGAKAFRVNLNEVATHRLNLDTRRIGPRDAVLLMNIQGHLDSVSARNLVEAVEREANRGVRRVVMYWQEEADPIDILLGEWLLSSCVPADQAEYIFTTLPKFPPLEAFHLGRFPVPLDELDYLDGWHLVHERHEEAVDAALHDVLPWISPGEVQQQIIAGHPWSQRAALRHPQVALTSTVWPILQAMLLTDDTAAQVTAIAALSRVNSKAAFDELVQIVASTKSEEIRTSALYGLVRSTNPEAARRIRSLLDSKKVPLEPWVITTLAESPQNEFEKWILEGLKSVEATVRVAAIEGLDRLGSESLGPIAQQALADSDPAVRKAAFNILAARDDRTSSKAALDYAFRSLDEIELDYESFELIQQARDPRFAGPLLKLIESQLAEGENGMLIDLLAEVGDSSSARDLADLFPKMTPSDQYSVLESLRPWDSDLTVQLSLTALQSSDPSTLTAAVQNLCDLGDEASIRRVIERFDAVNAESQIMLATILSETNSHLTREALLRMRDKALKNGETARLSAAISALASMREFSPGWGLAERGYYYMQQEELDQAIQCFELAAEIDPELASAYSWAGNSLLRQDKLDAARKNFDRAIQLDPFDDQAITGVGIAMARQGEPEAAVKLVLDLADHCPDNYVFEYNVGCVYGRAVENLRTRPASPDRDALIESYSEAGISRISTSIQLGFDDHSLIQTDLDLDGLRQHPKFGKWNSD